ncbi:MAG: OprD family outer membrane porin [Desulfobaccales bacterium]
MDYEPGFSRLRLVDPPASLHRFKLIRVLCLGLALSAVGILGSGAPVWGQEALRLKHPPPTSVEESKVPTDLTFKKPLEAPPPTNTLKEKLKEQLKDLPPVIRDATLEVKPRTYYLYRNNYDNSKNEAWALGGALEFKSGYLWDHVAVGAAGYTSDHLYAPPGRDGTLLLKPTQKNINVLGQAYGEVKINDHVVFDLFRKAYDTPYINQHDNRMVPQTFEAYTVRATMGGKDDAPQFRCGGGYFTRMKTRDSSQFVPMSVAAGVNNRDRGVAVGGAALETKNYSLGAINYYSQDIINIFYTEGKYTLPHESGLGFQLAAQFTDQEGTGSNLLYGRPFSTRQFGLRGNLSYQGAMLTLAYTNNAIGGANMFESWGSYPGYTSVQYSDFNNAGEQAFMIQGTYNLKHLGLEGVTFYALWVHGWNWVNPTTRQPVPQENEFNLDLQWKPKVASLKGFWFRLCYAHNWQWKGGNETVDELRLIVNYHFSVL